MRFIIVPPAPPTAMGSGLRAGGAGLRLAPRRGAERANQPESIVAGRSRPVSSSKRHNLRDAAWFTCGRARRWPVKSGTTPGDRASVDPGAHILSFRPPAVFERFGYRRRAFSSAATGTIRSGSPCNSILSLSGQPSVCFCRPGVEQMVPVANAAWLVSGLVNAACIGIGSCVSIHDRVHAGPTTNCGLKKPRRTTHAPDMRSLSLIA